MHFFCECFPEKVRSPWCFRMSSRMKSCKCIICCVEACESCVNQGNKKDSLQASLFSGAKESRTPDLLHAMQALYQLSYNPKDAHKYRMKCCTCQGNILKKMKFFSKWVWGRTHRSF